LWVDIKVVFETANRRPFSWKRMADEGEIDVLGDFDFKLEYVSCLVESWQLCHKLYLLLICKVLYCIFVCMSNVTVEKQSNRKNREQRSKCSPNFFNQFQTGYWFISICTVSPAIWSPALHILKKKRTKTTFSSWCRWIFMAAIFLSRHCQFPITTTFRPA